VTQRDLKATWLVRRLAAEVREKVAKGRVSV